MTGQDLRPVSVMPPHDRAQALMEVFLRIHSKNTAATYRPALRNWLDWCTTRGVDPFQARYTHISLWLADQRDAGNADGTRATRLSAVSSWYSWLIREEVVGFNPAALTSRERPKPNPNRAPALSEKQAEALLKAADADGSRSSALIALMIYTGARVSELLNSDVEDIAQDAGITVLRITGKGRKRRDLPLIPAVFERLERYLSARPGPAPDLPVVAGQAGARPRRPLLCTETGRRMERKQVRRDLLRLGKKASLPPEVLARLCPHSTRATYATANLAADAPLRDVQYALGHADPRTTEGYDRGRLQPDRHPSTRLATRIRPPDLPRPDAGETVVGGTARPCPT